MTNERQHGIADRNDKTLDLVRELGFDSVMCVAHGTTEKVVFYGPYLGTEREVGSHASEEAIKEFIAYWENQIQVAKDYLANGRNNVTTDWSSR